MMPMNSGGKTAELKVTLSNVLLCPSHRPKPQNLQFSSYTVRQVKAANSHTWEAETDKFEAFLL